MLVDTGPLVAILKGDEEHHALCVQTLARIRPPLLTCWPVLTEVAWLLRDRPRALRLLFTGAHRGLYRLMPLAEDALPEVDRRYARYQRLRPQLADLALVYLAETSGSSTIFTLDRRDFHVMRQRADCELTLLPEVI